MVPGADPSILAALPLFDDLSESERDEVAAWFEAREVGEDVKLVGEGTTGHSFFVICDGEVSVKAGEDEIATLGSGDFFGELALLATGRRTATVMTTKPSHLLVLFGNDFTRLQTKYPAIAAELEATMERRLHRS
jgi:CRP-like cAMP-binding protein